MVKARIIGGGMTEAFFVSFMSLELFWMPIDWGARTIPLLESASHGGEAFSHW